MIELFMIAGLALGGAFVYFNRCSFSLHKWGKWDGYKVDGGNAYSESYQTRTCSRCGSTTRRYIG